MTLTRKAFVQWLREQNPERTFKRGDPCGCPLGRWTGMRIRESSCTDSPYGTDDPKWDPLPNWAVRFVAVVDDGDASTITAARCLELLGEKP